MYERIHITGVQRTGTTLMKHLFACFANTWISDGEHGYWTDPETLNSRNETAHVISKSPWEEERVPEMLKDNPKLKVIIMIRDPRDIFTSTWVEEEVPVYITNSNMMKTLGFRLKVLSSLIEEFPNSILPVRYEDLVSNPEQEEVRISRFTGLVLIHSFREWGYTVKGKTDEPSLKGTRPLTTEGIGRFRNSPYRSFIEDQFEKDICLSDFLNKWYPELKY